MGCLNQLREFFETGSTNMKLWQGNVFTPVCHFVHGGGSLSGGPSLSRVISVQVVSVWEVSVQGGVFVQDGLCPWGVYVQGGLCPWGVYVQGVYVWGDLCPG